MKQNLCTIPLSEVLEPKRGCPFCRMERMLEERLLEYILGPAMMEPDIRIRTNQEGFCPRHLEKMLARRNKLQTALLLETRLLELEKRLFTPSLEKAGRAGGEALESCFLCRELAEGVERLLATFFRQYDASLEGNESVRTIAVSTTPETHIIQLFEDYPTQSAAVTWRRGLPLPAASRTLRQRSAMALRSSSVSVGRPIMK